MGQNESYDKVTKVRQGTFGFDGRDSASFLSELTPIEIGHPVRALMREDMKSLGYVYYTYEDFEIAVNWENSRGEFWLGPQ